MALSSEQQNPSPAVSGAASLPPHVHPRCGNQDCGSWEGPGLHRSHSGLCPPSQCSPRAALVMSALGTERGGGGLSRSPPRLGQRRACLCPGSRSFHRTVAATATLLPNTLDCDFTLFSLKKKKKKKKKEKSKHTELPGTILLRLHSRHSGKNF